MSKLNPSSFSKMLDRALMIILPCYQDKCKIREQVCGEQVCGEQVCGEQVCGEQVYGEQGCREQEEFLLPKSIRCSYFLVI